MTTPTKSFDLRDLDKSVRPQDDFYRFANGGWVDNNPIPNDRASWASFDAVEEMNLERLRGILEKVSAKRHTRGTNEQKLRDFWLEFINMEKRNKQGLTPLRGMLDKLDAIQSVDDIFAFITRSHRLGVYLFWNFGIGPDDKQPSENIVFFGQGGMGLPARDYYFESSERFLVIRDKYIDYIKRVFELSGCATADAHSRALSVMYFEKRLAEHAMRPQEMRDIYKVYNKLSSAEIAALMPLPEFERYFTEMGFAQEKAFIVQHPDFFQNLYKLLQSTDLAVLKDYLHAHLLSGLAPHLSDDFINAHFDFYGKVLSGTKELPALWKRGVDVITAMLDHAISPLYVRHYFDESAKDQMHELSANIKIALGRHIEGLSWMSVQTKKRALKKLENFDIMVGYPDKWRDLNGLRIGRAAHIENFFAANKFNKDYNISKLGKPVDRREWGMAAATVNAYIRFELNHLVFPAGILQPPFFDPHVDSALNYGAIGAIIGHEAGHAFDDQGRKYNEAGVLSDWWAKQDEKKFNQLASLIISQFNGYSILDGVRVNGELTQGENIGDLCGLNIAFDAYVAALNGGNKGRKINGFTPVQRFFLGWARLWRGNIRDEFAHTLIVNDPHSPLQWRANGPVTNMDAFHEAFDTKPGDGMYKPSDERIVIW